MSKPRMIGYNRPYIPNARRDKIRLKTKTHFARGDGKTDLTTRKFAALLERQVQENAEETQTGQALPLGGSCKV